LCEHAFPGRSKIMRGTLVAAFYHRCKEGSIDGSKIEGRRPCQIK
jgi:hypothetical protein